MEIKTIAAELKALNNETFDNQVNAAIKEGYKLSRRELLSHIQPPTLYAELVKMPQPKPLPTWAEAVTVLRSTCRGAEECAAGGCPMFEWCQEVLGDKCPAPSNWKPPILGVLPGD